MAVSETREFVIEASPQEILDVIADLDALPEWSSAHQSVEVVETGDDGRPKVAKMTVKTGGITDEQMVAYTWGADRVSWTLLSSTQQRAQDGSYTLTADGDRTRLTFDLTVDPIAPVPGFLLKRIIKSSLETATEGLRKYVLKKTGR